MMACNKSLRLGLLGACSRFGDNFLFRFFGFCPACLRLEHWFGHDGLPCSESHSAASATPPCAFDQPAGSPMNFSTSPSIFGSNLPLVLATARTSFQVVSA